jgi:undecaprenyl diphosphate synthase
VIGRRDRLPMPLAAAIGAAERATAGGRRLLVRLAIDYSARDQLLEATRRLAGRRHLTRADVSGALGPDVDLLIRTSGERRLSDFLLWESAYAELLFIERLWPDFDAEDLSRAVAEFHRRDRRFGGLTRGETA